MQGTGLSGEPIGELIETPCTRSHNNLTLPRDQGLLYYLFAVREQGFVVGNANTVYRHHKLSQPEPVPGVKHAQISLMGPKKFTHFVGYPKPWDPKPCTGPRRTDKKNSVSKLLLSLVDEYGAFIERRGDKREENGTAEFCLRRLTENSRECSEARTK
ncbi:hypothetical protein AAMO2058_000805100 [Amorphochlora amoebiformis]